MASVLSPWNLSNAFFNFSAMISTAVFFCRSSARILSQIFFNLSKDRMVLSDKPYSITSSSVQQFCTANSWWSSSLSRFHLGSVKSFGNWLLPCSSSSKTLSESGTVGGFNKGESPFIHSIACWYFCFSLLRSFDLPLNWLIVFKASWKASMSKGRQSTFFCHIGNSVKGLNTYPLFPRDNFMGSSPKTGISNSTFSPSFMMLFMSPIVNSSGKKRSNHMAFLRFMSALLFLPKEISEKPSSSIKYWNKWDVPLSLM